MHAVVTGSSGFVGKHVVSRLAESGVTVTALDIASTGTNEANVTEKTVDLRDRESVKKALIGADVVYHAASRVQTRKTGSDEVFDINVGGTQNLLDSCSELEIRKFVYVSSASVVYGGSDIEKGDEYLPYPTSFHAPYAESKMKAEAMVLRENDRRGVYTCAVRPHIVFGPGDKRFFPAVLGRAKAGKLKAYVGDPKKLSDFTYIDNLVDGLVLAADALGAGGKANGQAYFVTNGEPTPFWEFVGKLLDGVGYARPTFRVPFPIAFTTAAIREAVDAIRGIPTSEESLTRFTIRYLTTHHYFTHQKATADLGYKPRVSLDEGIRRTIDQLKRS
jgi:nucleoside-diphosphate-sugar epimerase